MSQGFVIVRPDGVVRRIAGYRFAPPPADVPRVERELAKLPPRVDLRRHMAPVEDQGDSNSAVANASAGAYEYLLARHRPKERRPVSRLFAYYNARAVAGLEDTDDITALRSALNASYDQYAATFGPINRFGQRRSHRVDPDTGEAALVRVWPPQGGFRDDPYSAVVYGLTVLLLLGKSWFASLLKDVGTAAEAPPSKLPQPPDPTSSSSSLPDNTPPPTV